jgi:hypothetical protein
MRNNEPNPIQILQQQAATKRDEAIKAARTEFTQTLRLIDDLGERLFYERRRIANRSPKRPIIDLIVEAMPKKRPFQLREVLTKLRKAQPKRNFHEPTIRTLFKRLSDQGRILKHSKGERGFILWVASECPVDVAGPMAALSLSDVAEQVLREAGPLRAVEVVLAVQERGYRPGADRHSLLNNLSQAFKRNGHRFVIDTNGRWSSV